MSRRQAYFDLLGDLEQATGKETESLFGRIQEYFGVRHQSYMNISLAAGRQKALDMLHTFPEDLVQHYTDNDLHLVDPIAQAALTGITPVDWQAYINNKNAQKLFATASSFGVSTTGVTIPLLCRGNQAAHFAIDVGVAVSEWPQYRREHIGEIQILATYLHGARQEMAQDFPEADLTAREAEVLKWTAAGKSYWEISMILGISERTVRFFMTNARKKLGVVTNSQAVAQAVLRGMIPL